MNEKINQNHINLFIVEDDPMTRELYSHFLKTVYPQVHLFENAEQALHEINNQHPEIILVDHDLPGMSGSDFVRQARQILGPASAILVITGHNQPWLHEKLRTLGADLVITKPCKVPRLLQLLENAYPKTRTANPTPHDSDLHR